MTQVAPNPAANSMRAMVLHAMDNMKWRHHGVGVLQGYLVEGTDPEVRVHVWSPRLLKPGIDISGDIHDHRFDMVSHVLCGVVGHEVFEPTPDILGDYRVLTLTHARAAAENKFHGPTEETPGIYSVTRKMTRIISGCTYTFPALQFHRSVLQGDVAVSVVEKHNQRDDIRARILYPHQHPPVMAFGHDMDGDLIASVLATAKEKLRQIL